MGTLVINATEKFLFDLLGGMLKLVGLAAGEFARLGTLQTQLPWVSGVKTDVLTVTWSLFACYLAYLILTRYILWHEGTADTDGSVLMKSVLRAAIFIGISSTLATLVWTFGAELATYLMASPIGQATAVVGKNMGPLKAMQGINADAGIFMAGIVAAAVVVVALIIMVIQFAIRSAEIVFYVIAGPIVSLGYLASPEGGTWAKWWTNLVVLGLSAVPQLLALKGLVASTQAIAVMSSSVAGASASLVLALLLQIGWVVVGIKGPHLLKEWVYHTGIGGTMVGVGTQVGNSKIHAYLGKAVAKS